METKILSQNTTDKIPQLNQVTMIRPFLSDLTMGIHAI